MNAYISEIDDLLEKDEQKKHEYIRKSQEMADLKKKSEEMDKKLKAKEKLLALKRKDTKIKQSRDKQEFEEW